MPRTKTHVQISRHESGGHSLIVDGLDLSTIALADGLTVQFSADPAYPDLVTFTVAADVLDIDLPDVAIQALRADGDA